MDRKQAALFYKATLENKNIKADRLIEEFYAARGETNTEIDKKLAEYKAIIEDAGKQGLRGWDIYSYLMSSRDKVEYIEKSKDGKVTKIEIEGDPKFDPSGKTDLTPLTGSPDFEFGDDSVNKKQNSSVNPKNVPVFGDEPEQKKSLTDDLPPLPDFNMSFGTVSTTNGVKNEKKTAFSVDSKNIPTFRDDDKSETKIKSDMSIKDTIVTMGEGNPGAIELLAKMFKEPFGLLEVLACDSLGIRGSKLYMLYNDCCGRNMAKFHRTLKLLRLGVFDNNEIHSNLGLTYAIPFIDDSIKVEGVPEYSSDEDFGVTHPKWNEYCDKNKAAFIKNLNDALNQNNGPKFGGF